MPTLTVLVATGRTQGQRTTDVLFATAGELVDINESCGRSNCGCCRTFTGLDSRFATTTAEVVERDLELADYVAAYHASLVKAGLPDDRGTRKCAVEAAEEMARIALGFPVGTVVERCGDDIEERT